MVLVQKKDGSHQFCVDYRGLDSVTKQDTFKLPRIDDLLGGFGFWVLADMGQVPGKDRICEPTRML